MKIDEPGLDSTYKEIIKPLIEKFNYRSIRIDEIENSGKIIDQILEEIAKSEIILCDLTGERPNCYFEAGFALALGKEIIFTIKAGSELHFDLKPYRFIEWKTEDELIDRLRKRLESIEKVKK